MPAFCRNRFCDNRPGMTLVELLVVIAIIVGVSAVVLPTLKESLKDQKITQASRQLLGLIESCKAQAFATGRPVGISFERLGADGFEQASSSIQVVRLEELPPYTGDFQDSGAYLATNSGSPMFSHALISQRDAAGLMSIASVGDSISFGDFDERFVISAISSISFQIPGTIAPQLVYRITFRNGTGTGLYPPLLFNDAIRRNSEIKIPFRLYRKPVRNELFVLQLPKNICIDLSCSGFANSPGSLGFVGSEFSVEAVASPDPWQSLSDFGPVAVMFAANGDIHRVATGAGLKGNSFIPAGDVYLLLGRLDRVSEDRLAGGIPTTDQNGVLANLMSSESLWIKISRSGGRVTSANVDGLGTATTLSQRVFESRATARVGLSVRGR